MNRGQLFQSIWMLSVFNFVVPDRRLRMKSACVLALNFFHLQTTTTTATTTKKQKQQQKKGIGWTGP